MTTYLKYLPLLALGIFINIFSPEHKVDIGDVGIFGEICFGVVAISIVLGSLKLNRHVRMYVFLGLMPLDLLLTHISYLKCGDWSFEANVWVGAYGSLLPIPIFSLLIFGTVWLILDTSFGYWVSFILCFTRIIAVVSHFFYWIT